MIKFIVFFEKHVKCFFFYSNKNLLRKKVHSQELKLFSALTHAKNEFHCFRITGTFRWRRMSAFD